MIDITLVKSRSEYALLLLILLPIKINVKGNIGIRYLPCIPAIEVLWQYVHCTYKLVKIKATILKHINEMIIVCFLLNLFFIVLSFKN